MTTRIVTCVVVECDDCETAVWDDGETGITPHFDGPIPDAHEILRKDYDWTITNTIALCPRCATARLCLAEGHHWGPNWSPTRAPHRVIRSCQRDHCIKHEDLSPTTESDHR